MAAKRVSYQPGDIFFHAAGHVKFQGDCVRGDPPKETKAWCIVGRSELGWMDIGTFDRATRDVKEGANHGRED